MLAKHLSLLCNELNKFNNTGARMLDSIFHMTLKLLKNCVFAIETVIGYLVHPYNVPYLYPMLTLFL